MSSRKNKKDFKNYNTITISDQFRDIIDDIGCPICWDIYYLDDNPYIDNPLDIKFLDISSKDYHFKITDSNGKISDIKMQKFIRAYLPKITDRRELQIFTNTFNKKVRTYRNKSVGSEVVIRDFKYEPLNVHDTFISLVTETYPYRTENDVLKFLCPNLTMDLYGNYYIKIGESNTMFTSHLDTACKKKENVKLYEFTKSSRRFIFTDGNTILGADDKAGVTVMLYMIEKGVPGLYYFFIGEEVGGIGSGKLANDYKSSKHLIGINKVVSFDRRACSSVITSQGWDVCCSDEFANALCSELNKGKYILNMDGRVVDDSYTDESTNVSLKMVPDDTGIFTDSASFMELIPECTNISVGYYNEHTGEEVQNLTFLNILAEAATNVDWENLPIVRKVGFSEEIIKKYSFLIEDYENLAFNNYVTIKGTNSIKITIYFDSTSTKEALMDVNNMYSLFDKYNIDPKMKMGNNSITIEFN